MSERRSHLTIVSNTPKTAASAAEPAAASPEGRAAQLADLVEHWTWLRANLAAARVAPELLEEADVWARSAFELLFTPPDEEGA